MMRSKISHLGVAAAVAALLAACVERERPSAAPAPAADGPAPPPTIAGPPPQSRHVSRRPAATMQYVASADGAGIEISARDRIGLGEAILIWPDGRETRATGIDRAPVDIPRQDRGVGVGVGAAGGSSSGVDTGVFVDIPVDIFGHRAPQTERAVDSRARIVVDDERAYRRAWQEMRVRLKFGFVAGETEILELPAPRPDG